MGREASIWFAAALLETAAGAGDAHGDLTLPFSPFNSSATASVTGKTVLEPSI
jgi:hypothetical protein